jgi:hypothetical protein
MRICSAHSHIADLVNPVVNTNNFPVPFGDGHNLRLHLKLKFKRRSNGKNGKFQPDWCLPYRMRNNQYRALCFCSSSKCAQRLASLRNAKACDPAEAGKRQLLTAQLCRLQALHHGPPLAAQATGPLERHDVLQPQHSICQHGNNWKKEKKYQAKLRLSLVESVGFNQRVSKAKTSVRMIESLSEVAAQTATPL